MAAAASLISAPFVAVAQPSQKVRRIGVLSLGESPKSGEKGSPIGRALQRYGYEEGKNLIVERRFAEGVTDRFPALANELLRSDVELIISSSNAAIDAVHRASRSIPIVMQFNMFPVERGVAASLARPGGNVTGTVWWARPQESLTKLFQILAEALPGAKRAAYLAGPVDSQTRYFNFEALGRAVKALGMDLTMIRMKDYSEGVASALKQLEAVRAEVFFVGGNMLLGPKKQLATFAIEHKLISISDHGDYVPVGGCLSYGPDIAELFDRTMSYVDRILRGAKPADLPIEQAHKFTMTLNARTARAVGFTPSPSLMLRVDQTIG